MNYELIKRLWASTLQQAIDNEKRVQIIKEEQQEDELHKKESDFLTEKIRKAEDGRIIQERNDLNAQNEAKVERKRIQTITVGHEEFKKMEREQHTADTIRDFDRRISNSKNFYLNQLFFTSNQMQRTQSFRDQQLNQPNLTSFHKVGNSFTSQSILMQHDDNKPIPLNIDQSPSNSIETGRTPQHSQTSNIQQGFDYTTNCRGDFYEKLMPYVTELIDGLDFEIQREMSKLQIEDNQEMEKDKDKQKDKDREKFKDKEKVRQKSFNS